jgi:VWFA-related protein
MGLSSQKFCGCLAMLVLIACWASTGLADDRQQEAEPQPAASQDPLEHGTSEKTTVRLVLVDVVVLDRQDRTVPDLTAEDFEVFALGKPVSVDTVDLDCPIGAADEPSPTRRADAHQALPTPSAGRRIVLAFDYLHLNQLLREDSVLAATRLVRDGGAGEDEIMVVALNGGVRIEQPFTRDKDEVLRSLNRMRYDVSLWNGNFAHINEFGFISGMTGMFDLLGSVAGPKAVVLFSGMKDVPLNTQFEQLAAVASTSRCAIYAVDPRGHYDPMFEMGQQPGIHSAGGG